MFCLNLDRFVSICARSSSFITVLIYFSKLSGLPSLGYYVSIDILYSMNYYMFYKICKPLIKYVCEIQYNGKFGEFVCLA